MIFTDTSIYKTVKMKNFPGGFLIFYSHTQHFASHFQPFLQLLNITFIFMCCFEEIFNLSITKVHKKLIFL
ncbi:hypothetical protein DRF67_10390 [Chryseobacterium pennipullorum]|uniref:Uncharacterized protein n=1 Tax=Chryseobacterium pennipullorum TaxID=2258963 RepID=A0A3D9B1B3_9FLAO|nr:hypothetical protein DRF67_10390 [Chryseobacterium pennipullorum]